MHNRPDANSLAMAFLTERHRHERLAKDSGVWTLRWYRGRFSIFRYGCDQVLDQGELRAVLASYCVSQNVTVSKRLIGDIVEVLAGLTRIDDGREPPFWLTCTNGAEVIAVANGNISLSDPHPETGRYRLLPHSPLLYSLTAPLAFDYDPSATCPRFQEFLAEIMGGDVEYIIFLRQLLGYLFIPGNPFQIFVIFLGPGANGKTTLIRLMEWLVGPENVSHVPLARFGDRFALQQMIGRRMNTASETIRRIDDEAEARLKELTGGDTLAAEVKFRQDHIVFTPTAKLVMATNTMPAFRDRSSGLWRRLHVVPFPISIPESRQDPTLLDKLKAEAPGILNLALDARVQLTAQGGFTVPRERRALMEDIRRTLDPVREFLTTTYAESSNGNFVPCTEVYAAYTEWAHALGVRLVDERQFGRRVRDIFPGSERRQRGGRGAQTWCYMGVSACTPSVHQQRDANGVREGASMPPTSPKIAAGIGGTPSTPSTLHTRAQGEGMCIGGEC